MIVVVIIGILAGLAIYNFGPAADTAREKTAAAAVKNLKLVIGMYHLDTGAYPTNDQWPQVLMKKATQGKEPYLEETPVDPWGEVYQYRNPGTRSLTSYDVYSKGPDKIDGTADDIGNWSSGTP